jgi:hypothetical protein
VVYIYAGYSTFSPVGVVPALAELFLSELSESCEGYVVFTDWGIIAWGATSPEILDSFIHISVWNTRVFRYSTREAKVSNLVLISRYTLHFLKSCKKKTLQIGAHEWFISLSPRRTVHS